MAEFKEVMRQRERMCNSQTDCIKCPLTTQNTCLGKFCNDFVIEYPVDAELIIMAWAAENPETTEAEDSEVNKNG